MITAIYTLAAGYWGVVMGDFLQGIVAVFAIVLVSLVGIAAAGGPAAITERHRRAWAQAWRLDPLAFTGWTGGEFPALWWLTMLVIAVIGGFGMGTSIDWYVEAQRIQSARTVRDASYGLWAGGAGHAGAQRVLGRVDPGLLRHAARHLPTPPSTSWAGSAWASSCCRPAWSASSSARSWRSTSRRSPATSTWARSTSPATSTSAT